MQAQKSFAGHPITRSEFLEREKSRLPETSRTINSRPSKVKKKEERIAIIQEICNGLQESGAMPSPGRDCFRLINLIGQPIKTHFEGPKLEHNDPRLRDVLLGTQGVYSLVCQECDQPQIAFMQWHEDMSGHGIKTRWYLCLSPGCLRRRYIGKEKY